MKQSKLYFFPVNIGFWSQEVSKALAFLLVGICAMLTMWYTVSSAEDIVKNFEDSPAVHLELRQGHDKTMQN